MRVLAVLGVLAALGLLLDDRAADRTGRPASGRPARSGHGRRAWRRASAGGAPARRPRRSSRRARARPVAVVAGGHGLERDDGPAAVGREAAGRSRCAGGRGLRGAAGVARTGLLRRAGAARGRGMGGDRLARGGQSSRGTAAYHRARPMADQLTLPLDATADRLPDLPDLRPMLPRPLPEPFDSDGPPVRAVVGRDAGPRVRRSGRCRRATATCASSMPTASIGPAALPELAGTAVRVAARSAILDGELVVVDADGRADAAALAARLAGGGRATGRLPRLRPAPPRRRRRCSTSRWPSVARRSGGSCARATRSSRCRPSRPRAGRCSRRSPPRGWPG